MDSPDAREETAYIYAGALRSRTMRQRACKLGSEERAYIHAGAFRPWTTRQSARNSAAVEKNHNFSKNPKNHQIVSKDIECSDV